MRNRSDGFPSKHCDVVACQDWSKLVCDTPSAEDERYGVLYRTNELSFHLRKASENGVSRDAILEAL